jgi:hypothetical protein
MPTKPAPPTAPEIKQRKLLAALLLAKLSAEEAIDLGASTLDVAEAILGSDPEMLAVVRHHLGG